MAELAVVFCTRSEIEANVVLGLLRTHGIEAVQSPPAGRSMPGLSKDEAGEVRVSVPPDLAKTAARVIADVRHDASRAVLLREAYGAIEAALGYRFADRGLLEQALTHRSRAHEDPSGGVADNERLEFLGDAVLGLVIADRLVREFPDRDEGWTSKVKARLVSAPTLARLGEHVGLGDYLLLGRGEEKTGGRRKQSLIADTFEAVVAAIYLDGGLAAASAFIDACFGAALDELRANGVVAEAPADWKSTLQEWLQARGRPLPAYRLTAEGGPDHRKTFTVDACVGEDSIACGTGRSKKEAEQKAARGALAVLRASGGNE
jgi:ribonuclease-3